MRACCAKRITRTLTTTLGGRFYCYYHFKDKETKAQRREAACPRPHSSQTAEQFTNTMARSRPPALQEPWGR